MDSGWLKPLDEVAVATPLYNSLPIPAQNLACTVAGWRRARERFTPHFHRTLREWQSSQERPRADLRAIQRRRLATLVDRARRFVPHYRGLRPLDPGLGRADPEEAITGILASIPVLEKQQYRDAPESFIAEDIPRSRLKRGRTSGTTGTALPLWYTSEAFAEEFAMLWRLRIRAGVTLDSPHMTFGGQVIVPVGQTRPPFWRTNHWQHQKLFSLYHMAPRYLDAYVEEIHRTEVHYAQGYPSSLHLIARAMLDRGRPLPRGKLRAVFTSSESLLTFQRADIEAAFGAPIRDRYGASELAVSMGECEQGRLHVDMEFGIVEVEIEEETADWVRGPLLVTGLSNDATPFLRYRIGDVGTLARTPCPCGLESDSFLDVDGRIEDYVVMPDGRRVGRLDHIFKDQRDIAEAQILQDTVDEIEFRIVPGKDYDDSSQLSLMKEIRERLGDEIEVRVSLVDSIPREVNGKFRAVKSRVGRHQEWSPSV
jgi:phenylacetate-CoA ligase